jgi:cellobiose phosphorylase/cellobionic acid phosphorylase
MRNDMAFGSFIDHGARYRITTPATPAAWGNVLFNDTYVMHVSQAGQGKSTCLKPTRKDVFAGNRFFYVVDGDDAPWCPLGRPLGTPLDSFECIHALGRTEWRSRRNGLSAQIAAWVPRDGDREIWRHTLTNESGVEKRIDYFVAHAFVHPGLYLQETACVDGILRVRCEPFRSPYEANDRANPGRDLFFLFGSRGPDSYACGETAFFGSDDLGAAPLAVSNRRCPSIPNHMQSPLGAFHYSAALAPGESLEVHVVGGAAVSTEEIAELRAASTQAGYWDAELARADEYWHDVSRAFTITTPDPDLDALVNFWLKKQVTFMARNDRSFVVVPVRNLLQDALGYSLIDPEYAISRMVAYAAWQEQGGFLWQWHALDGSPPSGNCLANYRDAPFWLVCCILAVLPALSDTSILDREVAFKDSAAPAPLYEHLLRALRHLARDTGGHGLCLLGGGDWFDPLNGPGRKGKGESTWLTMACRFAVQQMIPVCRRRGDGEEAARLVALDAQLGDNIDRHCWVADRFVAGFDDEGQPFGAPGDAEGELYLNPQAWALISQSVPLDKRETLLRTLARLDTPFGPLITWPAYTSWNNQVGRISLKQPGTTENGSVYCHGSMFAAFANCLEGRGDKAYDVIRKTLPTNPENPPEKNGQVPLFVPNFYFALPGSPDFGLSSQFYGTGTTAWLLWVTVEHLLGLRATADGLIVDPVVPPAWKEFAIERTFRGARYHVAVRNPHGVGRGVRRISVDGRVIEGALLPCVPGATYRVQVEMGNA